MVQRGTRLRRTGRAVVGARPASPFRRALGGFFGWSGWAKLAAIATTIAALGALWFTSQSMESTNAQFRLSEQGLVTERFGKAVEYLGSDQLDTRLGGIYLLERLAKDSPDDYATIYDVLIAFIRTHAPLTDCTPEHSEGLDTAAAVQVIARRERRDDDTVTESNEPHANLPVLDLASTCLSGTVLRGVELRRVNLSGAIFARTDLTAADLRGATLMDATFTDAMLWGARFANSQLSNADFTRARATGADLTSASLEFTRWTEADLICSTLRGAALALADLTDADLIGADLRDTLLGGADLHRANLINADLSGADLDGADLTSVIYDERTRWPVGFVPPPSAQPGSGIPDWRFGDVICHQS